MKHRIAIAAVTAAVLIGGGTAAAAAFADDSGRDSHDSAEVLGKHTSDDNTKMLGKHTSDDNTKMLGKHTSDDDTNDDRGLHTSRPASVTRSAAIDAALRSAPGTVTSIELDDADRSGGAPHWEVEINGRDGRHHELNVDARTAAVTPHHSDDGHHGGGRHGHDRHDDRDDD
ncbi:PepSY domain-containing protein [Streptomyces sp. NRRL S-1824]|uniref:PepSY domain-containing protein n=1 Tax=Streptomyces sp. NRRL S-1824 TaxID=1463889 RepID=UPI0004CB06B2|nr:PepSY domain-containing protein [Streptomyces sp. NRRL S-1824]